MVPTIFPAFLIVKNILRRARGGIWIWEKPHPVRRRDREHTLLACGFRRRAKNLVPQTFPRRKFPGRWWDGSSGATPELARGTRARPSADSAAVWAWAWGPGFRRDAWYRPRPIRAPCGAGVFMAGANRFRPPWQWTFHPPRCPRGGAPGP